MSQLKDDLITARAVVEKGWTQGAFARDAGRCVVDSNSPFAVAWCADGACKAAAGVSWINNRVAQMHKALDKAISGEPNFCCISAFNDAVDRTKDEVLAVFDKAIAAA